MTKIEAQVPDYFARQAQAVVDRENVPIDQIVALALLTLEGYGDDANAHPIAITTQSKSFVLMLCERAPRRGGSGNLLAPIAPTSLQGFLLAACGVSFSLSP